MFQHVYGFIECCCCHLTKRKRYPFHHYPNEAEKYKNRKYILMYQDAKFNRRSEALKHLYKHKENGHRIDRGAFARLKREIKELGDEV